MLDKLLEADVQKLQLIQKNIDDKKIDFEEKPFEERFPMIEHQEDRFPPDIPFEDRFPQDPNFVEKPFEERFPMIEHQEDKLK